MIKLKSLLTENVSFTENDEIMVISTPKGPGYEWHILIFTSEKNGKRYYDWQIGSPPAKIEYWNVGGKQHPMKVGGSATMGTSSTSLEQVQAELAEALKKRGLPYVQVTKIKPRDLSSTEHKAFVNKIEKLSQDFSKEMSKQENQPKKFGQGPPEYGMWVSSDDVKNGRLKWVVENCGDFWLVIKWSYSPKQQIKASELLKNYDKMIQGKSINNEYIRELFVRNNPFEGI